MGELRLKTLIVKLKKGRREYFDEFYELTKKSVYFTVRSLSTDKFFIEDVMQDAYVSFLTNLNKVDGNPLPYLIEIAKNKALDAIKKNNKVDTSIEIETLNLAAAETETDFPFLNRLKKQLTEEEYFILEKTVFMGFRRVEVAKMLNKPVPTVNRKYHVVLNKIKKMYKEKSGERN